jgi:hypothetical protein
MAVVRLYLRCGAESAPDRWESDMCEDSEYYNADDLDDMIEADEFYTRDGCQVEADGTCPHGYESPLITAGLI